jgi:hypothetical protein
MTLETYTHRVCLPQSVTFEQTEKRPALTWCSFQTVATQSKKPHRIRGKYFGKYVSVTHYV